MEGLKFIMLKVYGGFAGNKTMLSQHNFSTKITDLSGEIGNVNTTDDTQSIITNSETFKVVMWEGVI